MADFTKQHRKSALNFYFGGLNSAIKVELKAKTLLAKFFIVYLAKTQYNKRVCYKASSFVEAGAGVHKGCLH